MAIRNKLSQFALVTGCLLAINLSVCHIALATPILDFTGGSSGNAQPTTGDPMVGWAFDVNSAVTIDALGIWDEGADGLSNSHEVGLWEIDGTLLASTTITNSSTSASSTSSDGRWLFQSISSLSLGVGRYAIAAVYGSDDPDHIRTGVTINTITEIAFVEARTNGLSSLLFPNRSFDTAGYIGPNLRVETQHITEPTMLAIYGLGLVGLAYARRKRAARA